MPSLNKKWLPICGLFILIIYVGIVNMAYFAGLVSLPSPIYGGDYYYQLGHVYHFLQDGKFMQSSGLYDALPTYMPVYPYLIAKIVEVSGLTAVDAIFAGSLMFMAVSLTLWFVFLKTLFEENYLVVFVGLALMAFQNSIIIKYTDFALAIHMPLFLLSLYYFIFRRNIYTVFGFGLIYGLSALTYTIMFVGTTLLLLLLLTFEGAVAGYRKQFGDYLRTNGLYFFVTLATALPVAMVYWYEPIFVDHLHMYYNRAKLDFPDFGVYNVQIAFLKEKLANIFFNFGSLQSGLLSLLHIIGSAILFIDRSRVRLFVGGFFFAALLIVFSYFFTEPLFGTNLIPDRQALFFLSSAALLLTLYSLQYMLQSWNVSLWAKVIVSTILGLSLLYSGYTSFEKKMEDQWYQRGKQPMNPIFEDLGTYLRDNSSAEDVVLTTKELGFALNAVSGMKLVSGRWAHNGSPYTDLSERDLDLAVMLYGNNEKERKILLEKYSETYLYWNDFWVRSEFQINSEGKVVDLYDPLIAFDTPEHRKRLEENRLGYFSTRFWLEPSVRREDVKQYDILIVAQQNYRSWDKPWNPGLDPYLTKVWSYEYDGQVRAVLYKIDFIH